MVTGMVNLAPESLPITVSVVCSFVLDPNKVLTVVAVKLIEVPITFLDTLVPMVVVVFSVVVSVVAVVAGGVSMAVVVAGVVIVVVVGFVIVAAAFV